MGRHSVKKKKRLELISALRGPGGRWTLLRPTCDGGAAACTDLTSELHTATHDGPDDAPDDAGALGDTEDGFPEYPAAARFVPEVRSNLAS